MANGRRGGVKEPFWRDVLRRQARSRLSVAEFCRREGLSQPSFYAWRRTIAERDDRGPAGSSRSRPPGTARDAQAATAAKNRRQPAPGFLPVRVTGPAVPQPSIVIELAEGLVLRLPESMPIERLAELVRALEARRLNAPSLLAGAAR